MGEIAETAAKLVEPLGKLIDSVSSAIGKAYEPRHIRKMADAEAYRIKKIGEALRENSDIPIEYNPEGVSLSTVDFEQFVKRTQSRMAFQELKKQENIESVTDKAYDLLEGEARVTAEPVDENWMLRFFNCVEDISNDRMQELWARLLAGEIKSPGSFSLRTLEKLKNMNQREAKAFQELCQHAIYDGQSLFLLNNVEYLFRYEISYARILKLSECGLIVADGNISCQKSIEESEYVVAHTNDYVLVADKKYKDKTIAIRAYPFTESGAELAHIVNGQVPFDEVKCIAHCIEKETQIKLKIYRVTQRDAETLFYDEKVDLYSS